METRSDHTLDFNVTINDSIYDVTAEVEVYWSQDTYRSEGIVWEMVGYHVNYVEASNASDPEAETFTINSGPGEWWREVDSMIAVELENVYPPDHFITDMDDSVFEGPDNDG